MRKLYQFPQSGNSRTVRIILLEKGLEFERVNINFAKGEHKSPEFLKLNPMGKVPVLVEEGGQVFTESTVINEYLEDRYPDTPCLPPTPEERAIARYRVHYFEHNVAAAMGPIILEYLLKPPPARNMDLVAKKKEEAMKCFEMMEGFLVQDEWLTGKQFGLADAAYIPPMAALPDLEMAIPEGFKNLERWWTAVQRRASFEASAK